MAQLFHRRTNAIAKAIIIAALLLVILTGAGIYAFQRSDYWTRVDEPQAQPVPFSHQHHVGELGIDCRYCHTSVEKSAYAGVPPTETCMTCHSQIYKEAPVLQPVRDSWQTGTPLHWTRVHDLPDYAYFNHSIHVNKGIGCTTCHGQVEQMQITWKSHDMQMRWCLECHRNPEKFLRPTNQVFDLNYENPKNQMALGQELIGKNHVRTEGITDCYTCHR